MVLVFLFNFKDIITFAQPQRLLKISVIWASCIHLVIDLAVNFFLYLAVWGLLQNCLLRISLK